MYDKRHNNSFLIGEHVFVLTELIKREGEVEVIDFKRGAIKQGILKLVVEPEVKNHAFLKLNFQGLNLKNFGHFHSIHPYIRIFRPRLSPEQYQALKDGTASYKEVRKKVETWDSVYSAKSEEKKNPVFKPCIIGDYELCYDLPNCPLRVKLKNSQI